MKYIIILMFILLSLVTYAEDIFIFGSDELNYEYNPIFSDQNTKIMTLFPLLLLAIVIIMVLLDFLAIGVTIGSLLILIIGFIFKMLPLEWTSIMSMIVLGLILIYKMAQ